MIIIADAHISKANGNDTEFFQMLHALEANDEDIIFLGDIFDLWVAMPRYEQGLHRKFLAWCRSQKSLRSIGFIEGNHEFFVVDYNRNSFTWCSEGPWWRDDTGTLFTHGDQINRKDRLYLLFRKLTKNKTTKFMLRYLPSGSVIVEALKRWLKRTNQKFRLNLPQDEISDFADARFADGVDTIFVGHFHSEHHDRRSDSRALYLLPDWFNTRKVTVYQPASKKIKSIHWTQL